MCVKLIHDWIAIHYVVNSAGVDMYQKMDIVTLPAIQNNANMMVEIVLGKTTSEWSDGGVGVRWVIEERRVCMRGAWRDRVGQKIKLSLYKKIKNETKSKNKSLSKNTHLKKTNYTIHD